MLLHHPHHQNLFIPTEGAALTPQWGDPRIRLCRCLFSPPSECGKPLPVAQRNQKEGLYRIRPPYFTGLCKTNLRKEAAGSSSTYRETSDNTTVAQNTINSRRPNPATSPPASTGA